MFVLTHLIPRLKWAIVIALCPSSVNFLIFNFFFRTVWWILIKLGRDEVLMFPYNCYCFSARSAQGRIQGGPKYAIVGPLLHRTFSDRKATATSRTHSNDLETHGKKSCYLLLFHSKVKFWRVFNVFLDLVIFTYFNTISIGFMQ